ncbi:MAG TPA: 50S ribosomal protein L6 [Bacillales bacterium]|nr:50S ribosomal protein L6 [Bacillales bacterium]
MSRIGKRALQVPDDVTVNINNNVVSVKGPKGEMTREFDPDMKVNMEENVITVERPTESKRHRSLHGTTNSLIGNMIEGVTSGYQKGLQLVGVGYRANKQGDKLVLNVGYSHPVEIKAEEGIDIEVPENTRIIVKGIDKERVGAVAANIRSVRTPEPYKGKGIRYENERVLRKEGKTGK